MPDIIVTKHLFKRFNEIIAIDDLSFSVPAGKIYGFLGQNGAGKSTTIRMLLTLIEPSEGEIEIFGLNLKRHRKDILKRVGAIIERPDTYKYLTALENLKIFAAMSGISISGKQLLEHLEKVGLAERAKSKVKTYSQGMKQRLGIAIALINDPDLVILDEPMNGLDPQGIVDMRNLILHLSKEMKKTVFISSHLLNEMELIADSMLIIDKGKKVTEGKTNELFDPADTMIELQTNNSAEVYAKLQKTDLNEYLSSKRGDYILFRMHREKVSMLIKKLVQLDIEIISLYSKHSLENYFLSLTTENQHVGSFKN
ncbi:MAG TPA: ABC transporter ATP-binding protein [Chitinophagaceae bacterium]|jgi:ABC-type multidrug transport system ATPase subunit